MGDELRIRRRSDVQACALLMAQAEKFRREDDPDKARMLAMIAHELGHKPCADHSLEHLAEWVEGYEAPTVHDLAAGALLDPYLDLEHPPDGWHLIDNADADDVRFALEAAIGRIRVVLDLAARAHSVPLPGDDGVSMRMLDSRRVTRELRGG